MPGSEAVPAAVEVPAPAASCRGLSVDHVAVSGAVHALVDVDAAFPAGRLSVVSGPSGSGKSTLLRVLAGLHRPIAGTVEVGGVDLTRLRTGRLRRLRRRTMGVVLQDPSDNLLGYLTAIEQVELAARLRGTDPGEAPALLDAVGLAGHARSPLAALSGGEQQRLAFAAAAVGAPALVLADEPTAQLDAAAGAALVATMRRLVTDGATLVVASHDADVVAAADHVVTLRSGHVAEAAA